MEHSLPSVHEPPCNLSGTKRKISKTSVNIGLTSQMFLICLIVLCWLSSLERTDYGEDRWIGIGFLRNGVAVVVWTERQGDVIRIISARRANRYERQRFEQYLSY